MEQAIVQKSLKAGGKMTQGTVAHCLTLFLPDPEAWRLKGGSGLHVTSSARRAKCPGLDEGPIFYRWGVCLEMGFLMRALGC